MDDPTRPHRPGRPATRPVSGPVVPPDTSMPLDTLTIRAGDGQPPLVTLNLTTGEMTFGPGYTPDAAAEAFWDAIRLRAGCPASAVTQAPEPGKLVRYDCPFCDWYTHPAGGSTRESAYRQIGSHILGIHAREPVDLVHRLVQTLPNAAGAPLPIQGRGAARLDDPMTAETDRAISDFGPPARSAARKDPRYPAALEQVRKMAWPSGKPMVPGGWAETLAKDVLAAIRREEGHHRPIDHHAYEGPGPCRASYFGSGACGYPRAEHELIDGAGAESAAG